jgi:hypothetical protein
MGRALFLLLCVFGFAIPEIRAQIDFVNKKDLRPEWRVHSNLGLTPYTPSASVHTIYFEVSSSAFRGDYLCIRSSSPFSLFVNGLLTKSDLKFCRIPTDSLRLISNANTSALAVHQANGIRTDLETRIQTRTGIQFTDDSIPLLRSQTGFHDFSIASVLLLTGFLLLIFRLNPKLSSGYLNFTGIFSLRESDENQHYSRIGNSTNILFYLFVSLLLGMYWLHMIQKMGANFLIPYDAGESFWGWMLNWLMTSLVVLTLLFIKVQIIFVFSLLFGISDQSGFHFFNFIRTLLLVFGLLSIMVVIFYLTGGVAPGLNVFLYSLIGYVLLGWAILSFLKLAGRVSHPAIHLFSYICATEIMPLLIIIKVLYK